MTDRTPKKDIHEELKAIYTEQGGEMPNLTELEHRKESWLTRLLVRVVLVLLVLAGSAWGGYFLWNRGVFDSGKPLEVSMEGPTQVSAGQLAYFTVRYQNKGNVPISQMEMKMNLPLGFEIETANPSPSEGTTWLLDALSPGSDGSVIVSGVFRSEVPTSETLQAFFTYRPANFTSDFQGIATVTVEIPDSVVDVAITGPEKALAGDDVSYVINVQNSGLETVKNIRIIAEPPQGFTLTGAEPASIKPDTAQWNIAELAPGALAAITMRGKFTSTASGEQLVQVRAALVNADDVLLTQHTAQAITDVLGGNLAFHLIINGSNSDITTNLDDALRVSIDYTNSGNEALADVVFRLTLAGDKTLPIEWEGADLGGGTRAGNTITWDTETHPEFASLQPNSAGLIDLTLPIPPEINAATMADRFTFTLTGSLSRVGSVESPRTIDSTPITVAINSDLRASGEARYYTVDGEPIGTGPLPPTVGETTTYRIIWNVANTLHTLNGLRMTAVLPQDVAWVSNTQTSLGTISFNETTRLVTWSIDRLPKETVSAEATFDIAITPKESDVGAFFKLINATSVEAVDEATNGRLSEAVDLLTTELPTDETAKGKGVVVE